MTNCWLACRHCGAKELVKQQTVFGPCPVCGGGPRYAEGDKGEPMFVFTNVQDPTSWDDPSTLPQTP